MLLNILEKLIKERTSFSTGPLENGSLGIWGYDLEVQIYLDDPSDLTIVTSEPASR